MEEKFAHEAKAQNSEPDPEHPGWFHQVNSSAEKVILGDVVLRSLSLHYKPWRMPNTNRCWFRVYLHVMAIYLVVFTGGGYLISWLHTELELSGDFLSLVSSTETLPTLLMSTLAAPTIWTFYLWQPKGLAEVLHRLCADGIVIDRIGTDSPSQGRREVAASQLLAGLTKSWLNWRATSLVFGSITALSCYLWYRSAFAIGNPWLFGHSDFWYHVDPVYFWLLWIPMEFAPVYACIWIIARTWYAVKITRQLLGNFELRPKLFHSDGLNGFSEIGRYVRWTTIMASIVAAWLTFILFYAKIVDHANVLITDRFAFTLWAAAYILFPVLLIWLLKEAHVAMQVAKHRELHPFRIQIERQWALAALSPTSEILVDLAESIAAYRKIESELHVWPFQFKYLLGFAAYYSFPAILLAVFTGAMGNVVYSTLQWID